MGNSSSWKTRVEKGVHKSPPKHNHIPSEACICVKPLSAGEGAGEHLAVLTDEEACVDDEVDEAE